MTDLGFGQFLSEQIRVYAIVGTGAAPYLHHDLWRPYLHHDLWRAFFSGLIVSNGERCLFYTVLGSDGGGELATAALRASLYGKACGQRAAARTKEAQAG